MGRAKGALSSFKSLNFVCYRMHNGPVVKWYNAAFALRRREFNSPQVHKGGQTKFTTVGIRIADLSAGRQGWEDSPRVHK